MTPSDDLPGPPGSPLRPSPAPPPLLEALLVFAAFWLRGLLPLGGGEGAPGLGSLPYQLGLLATLLPSGALLLYLMSRLDGLEAFGSGGQSWSRPLPRPRELPGALLMATLVLLVAWLPQALVAIFPPAEGPPRWMDNPLLASLGRPDLGPLLFLPLILLTSLATGYVEELFFRVYLLRRLQQAGLGAAPAVLVSSLAFGLAHGAQGPLAGLVATVMGAFFALGWRARGSWHEIALGHGLYDFIALAGLFYLQPGL